MIGVSIKSVNFERTIKATKKIQDKLDRPGGFLGYAGAQGHREIIKHFTEESGPDGKWEPLASRRGKALQDTGRLKASVVWHKMSTAVLRFIALVKYSGYHDQGTRRLPQRQFMWFSSGFMDRIKNNFVRYVLRK